MRGVLSFMVIVGLANAASALPLPSETLSGPDPELLVFCGMLPEFDPVQTMPGLLMDQPRDTQKVEQPGKPVGNGHEPAPIPEPTSFVLVCLGLMLIGIVRKSLRT
jgi:hypothetical protein